MHWPVSLHIYIAIPYLLLYWYVGTKFTNALVHGFQCKRRIIKNILLIFALWPLCVPLILFVGSYIDESWVLKITLGEIRILDYLLLYPFWVGLVCIVELGIVFLFSDIARLLFSRPYRRNRGQWLHVQGWIIVGTTVLVLLYVGITIYRDTATVRISTWERHIPKLPKSLDGFRIVHISDIQIDNRTNRIIFDDVIRDVRLLTPDLVIFTGDLITSGTRYVDQGARIVGEMHAKHGTYACIGNHDVWAGRDCIEEELRRNHVNVLVDTASIIQIGTAKIELREIDNFSGYRARSVVFPKGGTDSADLRIIFTHSASRSLVDSAAAHHYDIFLGGHSHGGQVAPGIGWWRLIMSRVQTPYVSGFYTAGSMIVSVTNGIGLTVAPIRFQAPAEISVIVLRSR
jgi:predicted MPP superfamily phosphohydrolase